MRRSEMTLSTVVKMVLILVVLAILLFLSYRYLLKGTQDQLNPIERLTSARSCCVRHCMGEVEPTECGPLIGSNGEYNCNCANGDVEKRVVKP